MKFFRFLVQMVSGAVNFAVLAFCLLLLSYGCYAIWDSQQLTRAADNRQYAVYKPTEEDARSFEELKAVNPDVFGWLNVYGTNIDYPLVQGEDNSKYVNTNVDGEYSLIGSLFLDCRNKNDFSDFNSIIYGHHMAEDRMFGDIADFGEKEYFDSHRYGSLFFGGETRGLEFLAFLEVDAYDDVYSPGVQGEENRRAYLDHIFSRAVHMRESDVDLSDRLVLLSTCASAMTNGRHILVGRITDEVQADPFYQEPEVKHLAGIDPQGLVKRIRELPVWVKGCVIVVAILLVCGVVCMVHGKWKKRKR